MVRGVNERTLTFTFRIESNFTFRSLLGFRLFILLRRALIQYGYDLVKVLPQGDIARRFVLLISYVLIASRL